ncbi:GIY-YIG nuclease family protein [Vampirovibrio sp.]|uniref:GIY-YIG nuclease family protein n=1 Tax=Vampirovibrio sp. TaxID=2717857 RepID=UPI00359355C9
MPPIAPLSDIRFTLICVKTVNDLQSNSDVVELACVKIRDARIAETLHMRFSPPHALPEEFTRKTGIYTQSLRECPPLESVLPELAAFVERDVILWANPPGTTNAVHRYFKLTQPRDRQFFLLNLAQKLLPDLPRHGLNHWAAHWGLETDGLARTENAAIIGAKVFLKLLDLLGKQGVTQFAQLLDFCPGVPVRVYRTRNELPFDRNRLKDYPAQPGVYLMKNRMGEILYVGKAKNLKVRLRSYFQKQSRLPSKIAVMMRQVTQIEVMVVGSELEALILESRLIKQHQPFFNQKVKDYQQMVFMAVSVNARFPRLSLSEDSDNPELAYFGPFHGLSSLKNRLEVLNRSFQLRDCSDRKFEAHRASPCMQYQLGLCSGPCAGKINEADYQERVADFLRFLAQQPCNALDGLTAKREAYVEALRFEKAALIQEQLELLGRFRQTSYRLIQAVTLRHCLIVLPAQEPGCFRLLSVLQGQPHQWKTIDPVLLDWDAMILWIQQALDALDSHTAAAGQPIPKSLYEESRLIAQWLEKRSEHEGAVIAFADKSARMVFNELLLAISPAMRHQFELNAAEEAWDWEREQHG